MEDGKGGHADGTAEIVLENELIKVVIFSSTGGLKSFEEKENGRELLHHPTGRLFRFVVDVPGRETCPLDGERQQGHAESVTPTSATVAFSSLTTGSPFGPARVLDIGVSVDFELAGDELLMSIVVDNRSTHHIRQVQFPLVSGWTGFDGPGNDIVTTGSLIDSGTVDPHADNLSREVDWYTLLGAQRRWEIPFPVRTATPWLDISGVKHGASLINYMKSPRAGGPMVRDFATYDVEKIIEFGWYSQSDVPPDSSWQSDSMGVSMHKGDWHSTADRYREWLGGWWKPVMAPESFKRSLGFQNVMVTDFDGARYRTFADLPDVVKNGAEYGVRDLCIWDYLMLGFYHRTVATGLHDYGAVEERELRSAIADCQELGAHVSCLTNMRLVLPGSEWWKNGGSAGAITSTHGEVRLENWAVSGSEAGFWPRGRGPVSTALCATSEQFRELADENLSALQDLGFDSYFLDQPFEDSPCFNQLHGHRDTGDAQRGVVEWVRDFRRWANPGRHEGYVVGEQPDVFVAQGVDVFWNWNWLKARPDVIAYTLPTLTQTYVVDRNRKDALEGFLHGFQLAFCTRGLTGTLGSVDPEFSDWVRELSRIRIETADSTTLARFVDDVGIDFEGEIRAKRFESAGGTAVVITNPSDVEVRGSVLVEAPTRGASRVRVAFGSEAKISNNRADVAMPPWSVVVWEL